MQISTGSCCLEEHNTSCVISRDTEKGYFVLGHSVGGEQGINASGNRQRKYSNQFKTMLIHGC